MDKTKTIKQSVINTFKRIGLKYENFDNTLKSVRVYNRFGGNSAAVTVLVSECISFVYDISNAYERGNFSVKTSDFDRLRYFVLDQDRDAYMSLLD